jgi:putative protease
MEMKEIGEIVHYYTKIEVAVVKLKGELKVEDKIAIKGLTTDFTQPINSMEIEHEKIQVAKAGQSIGLKVKEKVREGDIIYKVLG